MAVALHYHTSAAEAEATARQIRALGVRCETLGADLLDEDAAQALVGRAAAALETPLDVLINGASIFRHDTIASADRASWDENVGTNLRAPVVLTQGFAAQVPQAVRQADGELRARACIVNMIDQRVRRPTRDYMSYTLGKMGLWAFTRTSALALAPQVRVNGIGPGTTLQGAAQPDAQFRAHRDGAPLGRGANAEDIVQAMDFFLDAHAVTGQLLCIDGGAHL